MLRHKLINPNSKRIDGSEFSDVCKKIAGVPIYSGEQCTCGNAKNKIAHVWYPNEVESSRKEITGAINNMYKGDGIILMIGFPSRFEDVPEEELEEFEKANTFTLVSE